MAIEKGNPMSPQNRTQTGPQFQQFYAGTRQYLNGRVPVFLNSKDRLLRISTQSNVLFGSMDLRAKKLIALLIVQFLLLQPLLTMIEIYRVSPISVAEAAPIRDETIYLPVVISGGQTDSTSGNSPTFVINNPIAGSTVGGTTYFSIQPTNAEQIDTVVFRAGNSELGADSDGSDGFRIFLDAGTLSSGATQLTATGSGPNGEHTESITVTINATPPQNTTAGDAGAILASEIGSVVTLLPGSVAPGTTVAIDELTQTETTDRHGIEWESMGVTFLGAQDIQASAPISGPFGMVSSANFGNRVQPGQAVVNYQLAPDVDGDGADEIVVVNTASVAPNGNVIADPLDAIYVQVLDGIEAAEQDAVHALGGPPGTFLEFAVEGFNYFSLNGNIAHFQSLNSDYEIQVAGNIKVYNDDFSKQYFRVALPYFPPGPATVILKNASTGLESDPIPLEIEALPALPNSAQAIISDYLTHYLAILEESRTNVLQDEQLKALILDDVDAAQQEIQDAQVAVAGIFELLASDPAPEVAAYLDDFARMIIAADFPAADIAVQSATRTDDGCTPPTLDRKALAEDFAGFMPFGTYFVGTASPTNSSTSLEAAEHVANAAGRTNLGSIIGAANAGLTAGSIISRLFNHINEGLQYVNNVVAGKCDDSPPPPPRPSPSPNRGGNNNRRTTGMGAAPPSGGNGFGFGGGGGSRLSAAATKQASSPIIVKIFVNGSATPFTGMTDDGGYFFVPFIPAGEPFTALAIETATGATRTFKGTGPQTDQSVFIYFDFYRDDGSGATPIEFDKVVEGEISTAGEQDFYSFTATAGQRLFFDLLSHTNLPQTNWLLSAPNGATIFNTCLGCGDPGARTLEIPGTYILTVGEPSEGRTGSYQFQVWNIPAPDEFTVAISDVISDGVPGPGAGHIESPGVEDRYYFTATAGQTIYADLHDYSGVSQINWQLHAPDGTRLFRTCLGCGDPGTQALPQSGVYTLTVGDDRDASIGTYEIQLWDVPAPDEFTIAIGDVISDGVPGPGAGNIESPGVADIYRFTAAAGQRVFFAMEEQNGVSQINWQVAAPDGAIIFQTCLGCGQPGVKTLPQAGTYELTVQDHRDDGTGTYQLRLWDVPAPDEFTVAIGDTIADGTPGPGAGNIELPGAHDIYRFSATAGQTVFFDLQEAAGLSQITWQLEAPDGTVLFNTCLGCSRPAAQTFAQSGSYVLTIGNERNRSTGAYRFQLVEQ